MSTCVTVHPETRPAYMQLSPKDEFSAIDEFLVSYEQSVTNWPAVAQACLRCKDKELWKHGNFTSWHDWIHKRAPFSARKIFYAVGLFKDLKEDYEPEELASMPIETAKVARQLSPSVRRDPKVKAASRSKRKAFVEVVKEVAPLQHIEHEVSKTFHFSETQWGEIEEMIEDYRILTGSEISVEEIMFKLAVEWRNSMWQDSPYSNREKAQQMRM